MSKKKPDMSHDPLADLSEPGSAGGESSAGMERGSSGPEEPAISLPVSLTVADVAEVHAAVMESLASKSAWTLDASEVEVIDGAGMQLLAALAKAAEQRQARLVWSGTSAVITAAAGALGLVEALQLDGNKGNAGA